MRAGLGETPLIVAGMHRSGTSFVAAWLQRAGVDLGEELLPPNSGNVFGYFENVEFVAFHERLLRASGHDPSGWSAPAIVPSGDEARAEARALVARHARNAPWGWKDPRTTLFLTFWESLLPHARYVCIYREPAEVVDSLLRRGDPAIRALPELAARAWVAHNTLLLDFVRSHRDRCILANVSAIARDPGVLAGLVTDRFGVSLKPVAESPFEPGSLRRFGALHEKAELLRYFMPECEQIFEELEREADAPDDTSASRATMPRRARDAVFSEWSREHEIPVAPLVADAAQVAGELLLQLCETRARLERNVGLLRAALDDGGAA